MTSAAKPPAGLDASLMRRLAACRQRIEQHLGTIVFGRPRPSGATGLPVDHRVAARSVNRDELVEAPRMIQRPSRQSEGNFGFSRCLHQFRWPVQPDPIAVAAPEWHTQNEQERLVRAPLRSALHFLLQACSIRVAAASVRFARARFGKLAGYPLRSSRVDGPTVPSTCSGLAARGGWQDSTFHWAVCARGQGAAPAQPPGFGVFLEIPTQYFQLSRGYQLRLA